MTMIDSQSLPSAERLREMFDYDASTGNLTWKARPVSHFSDGCQSADLICKRINARLSGKLGLHCVDTKGYRHGRIFGHGVRAHRVIFAMVTGSWPQGEIDHVNGVRTDNRFENLRDVSRITNMRNAKLSSRNNSGFVGVHWRKDRRRWQARIHFDGKTHSLGHYCDIKAAVKSRKAAEVENGFHVNHGRDAA